MRGMFAEKQNIFCNIKNAFATQASIFSGSLISLLSYR